MDNSIRGALTRTEAGTVINRSAASLAELDQLSDHRGHGRDHGSEKLHDGGDDALRVRVLGGGSVDGVDHVVEGCDPWRHVALGEGCLVAEDHVVETALGGQRRDGGNGEEEEEDRRGPEGGRERGGE